MRVAKRFGLGLTIALFSLAVPAASLGATPSAPRLPSSAADWATFSPQERAAALDYESSLFEAALAAGTLKWTSGSARPTVGGVTAESTSKLAATSASTLLSVDARCGLSWTFVGSGTWTYGWAYVDTDFPAYLIYAGKPPSSNQFIRSGTVLQYFYKYSQGAGSSYEYAQSNSNFKWAFENINYRTKSWMGVQRYQGGAWQLGPDAYCTYSANP